MSVEEKVVALERELEAMRGERDALRIAFAEASHNDCQAGHLETKITNLTSQLTTANAEVERLKAEVQKIYEGHQYLADKRDSARAEVARLQEELRKSEDALEKHSALHRELSRKALVERDALRQQVAELDRMYKMECKVSWSAQQDRTRLEGMVAELDKEQGFADAYRLCEEQAKSAGFALVTDVFINYSIEKIRANTLAATVKRMQAELQWVWTNGNGREVYPTQLDGRKCPHFEAIAALSTLAPTTLSGDGETTAEQARRANSLPQSNQSDGVIALQKTAPAQNTPAPTTEEA